MSKTLKTRIINKHDTQANWNQATSFQPLAGELIIYDMNVAHPAQRIKLGDGNQTVGSLPFLIEVAADTDIDTLF